MILAALTHINLASYFFGTWANSTDPDETPQNAASHLGLHCLLTGISIKNEIKKTPGSPKIESGLVQMIMMGKFIRQMWVNIRLTVNCCC